MRLLLSFLIISTSTFAQQKKAALLILKADTVIAAKIDTVEIKNQDFFTDNDLKVIDSLLVDYKFSSPLIDTLEYVLDDKDVIGNTVKVLTTDLLKERLSNLNDNTPFNLAFNPALEKVINSYLLYRTKYYPVLMAKAKYYFPMFE